jgi:hypothetical protein
MSVRSQIGTVLHRLANKCLLKGPQGGQGRVVLHTRTDLLAEDTEQGLRQKVGRGELVRVASGIYAEGADLSGRSEAIHGLRARAHAQCCAHVVSHV